MPPGPPPPPSSNAGGGGNQVRCSGYVATVFAATPRPRWSLIPPPRPPPLASALATKSCPCGLCAPSAGPAVGSVRTKSQTLMFGFTVTARELGKLHVQGNRAECREILTSLGGVPGIATKLSTNVVRGISGDQNDIAQRQEA